MVMDYKEYVDMVYAIASITPCGSKWLIYPRAMVDEFGMDGMIDYIYKNYGRKMSLTREENRLCVFEEDKTDVLKESK